MLLSNGAIPARPRRRGPRRRARRDDVATLDDLREAVTTLEELAATARRVLGSAHPTCTCIEAELRNVRTVLRAHDRGDVDVESIRDAVLAMRAGDG